MSNLGFVQAMVRERIAVEQTKVGDRYVLEAMKAGGHILGGEQSGHVVLSDHATTGDGTLTAVMLLARLAETRQGPAGPGRGDAPPAPGAGDVPNVDKTVPAPNPRSARAVAAADRRGWGTPGRCCCGPRATEPLVRVMVEAESSETAEEVAGQLAQGGRELPGALSPLLRQRNNAEVGPGPRAHDRGRFVVPP
jgi:phosphoglucosamine mutase